MSRATVTCLWHREDFDLKTSAVMRSPETTSNLLVTMLVRVARVLDEVGNVNQFIVSAMNGDSRCVLKHDKPSDDEEYRFYTFS